ncbi:restriction endonuclease subunit S [Arhodomonas aquaeolei]|uniref:restriction endonuclease subunit S n=1 Tax=Arhodomonas aquaeolei TaxID=2369 RepID=UPI002166F73F|nr:restriction endonuclease subunit S [Arhodomonas aquaeolei]MCS4503359.1 restriction endonuclease subunit S [Arhodomonas aquaeolei]
MSNYVRLGDLFKFTNGRAFKKSEWARTGLPIIRIKNLNDPSAGFNYFAGDYDKRIEVSDGDLLFSWSGTVGSSFGPHLWHRGKGVLNQHIFRVGLSEEIDKKYAYYALLEITGAIEKKVNGAVGIVHVTQKSLKEFKIPVPSLPEQKHIVDILDEAFAGIDTVIANTEKNLANARELFESALSDEFSPKSQDWNRTLLGEVLSQQPRNGWSPPARNHADMGTPVLTLSSVTGFRFRPEKVKYTSVEADRSRHYWVHNGDLLMTRSNTPDLVGHVAIAANLTKPTIYPDLIMRMRPDPDSVLTDFLCYQLRSTALRREITGRAQGANPTMKKISKQAVQTLPVAIPRLSTQHKVVAKLDSIWSETTTLEQIFQIKSATLAELKQSLLQRAFAGELTANNVVSISRTTKSQPPAKTNSPEFAAHIMAVAYHWHESQRRDRTFGRVKAQKVLHLVESLADMDMDRRPIKDAAGPNDSRHMRVAENWARENGFFEFVRRDGADEQYGYDFVKGERYGEWIVQAQQAVEPWRETLERVMQLMLPLNTKQAELVATVYAAWNNLLLDGIEPTAAAIIYEARDNWHSGKRGFSEEQFEEAIARLRSHGMVPTGTGKRVAGQESLGF